MPFSFLNPWLWLGALAVAAPLWLHLRRRRPTNVVRFSALRFLQDTPAPRRSPLRLQDVALFLWRALALVLLAAAFAWPFRKDSLPNPVEESRVYIFDNTLSHQAGGGFERSRARLVNEISQLSGASQLAVIELAAQPRVIAGFSHDRESARAAVQALRPSHQRGSYLSAFRLAQELLDNSLGERKKLILIGDQQENQWKEHLNVPPFLSGVEVAVPVPSATNAPNVFLAEPRLQRVFLGGEAVVNFDVQLRRIGDVARCQVRLEAGPKLLFDRGLELEGQPEGITLQAQWAADPKDWVTGRISVQADPDVLEADNAVYFSLPPVSEGKVALVGRSPFLRLALSPEVMRGFWSTRVVLPSEAAAELQGGPEAEVLVLESDALQSGDARQLVWRYLTNGRGVLLMVNRLTPVVAGALRELGIEPASSEPVQLDSGQPFRYIFPHHPIFYPFLSGEYGNLMEVKISRYYRLQSEKAAPLIFAESGAPLFLEQRRFAGKLLVAAFGFDREHSSWPTHPTFIPFVDLCLQNARPVDPAPAEYGPGQITLIDLPGENSEAEFVLRRQDKEVARVPVREGRLQIRIPDQPGLYSLQGKNDSNPFKVLAVNPPVKESETRYLADPSAWEVWRLDGGREARAAVRAASVTALSTIQRQTYWWWLALAALVLLTLEIVWTAFRKQVL